MRRLTEILETQQNKAPIPTLRSSAVAGPEEVESSHTVETCSNCDGARFIRITVDRGSPDFGRAVPCHCVTDEGELARRDRLVRYSRLGALERFTFATLVRKGRSNHVEAQARYEDAVTAAERFAEQPEGWLVISGLPGCGKTHLAAAIANRVIERGLPALFLSVADLLDHLRASYDEDSELAYPELLEQLRTAPLVVLDDLGDYAETPWAREKFFQLVSHRFHAALPTVFTCSRSPDEIDSRLGSRLCDPVLSQSLVLEEKVLPGYFQVGGMTRERLEEFTFENFGPSGRGLRGKQRQNLEGAFRLAREWSSAPDGWLLFTGQNGCGKTHLAAGIGGYRLEQNDTVCFATVPDLLDELRATFAPDSSEQFDTVFQRLLSVRLLILDDLGAHQSSPWAEEKLYQILNHRHLGRIPTVVTTNLELKDMSSRIASRLADLDVVVVYEIEAPDYRRGGVV